MVVAGEGGHGSGTPTYHDPEEAVMPWYAQRADLPDTHKQWADPGSQHEAVYQRIGWVNVTAPGSEAPSEHGDEKPVPDEPAEGKPRRKVG